MSFGQGCAVAILAMTAPVWAAAGRDVAPASLLERARYALESALRERHPAIERFELMPMGSTSALWQRSDAEATAIVVPAGQPLGRRASVIVRYRRSDGTERQSVTWWSVGAFRPVAVVRRFIRAREAVSEADVTVEIKDVAGRPDVIGDAGEIGPNRRARRFIPAGAALQRSDLDYMPEVSLDQQVNVTITAGLVSIETVAIAAKEGRTGDVIMVTNPASNLRYPARVTGMGAVSVGSATR